ncbi:hypothetical protein ACXYMX_11075 [Sporosarcina sp. CAU 1771]
MWEILFYLFVAPFLTLLITLTTTLKFKRIFLAPIIIFIALNIPTIVLPMIYNVGWAASFGWACLFTLISGILSLIIWRATRKSSTATTV